MQPHRVVGRAVLLALFSASSLGAQERDPEFPSHITQRFSFAVVGKWMEPVGELAHNVPYGVGGGLSVGYHFPGFTALGLRTEFSHHWYGWESKRVQLSPTANRVFVDMSTTNNIFVWTIGPELALRRGPVQPYALWHLGYSNFYTSTSVEDENSGSTFASTRHMSDGGWATEYGGGLRFSIKSPKPGKARVSLDVGGRMTINGTRRYLRSGDIVDNPDGSLTFNERRTRANFFQFSLGIAASEL
jgi:hypothetical protein